MFVPPAQLPPAPAPAPALLWRGTPSPESSPHPRHRRNRRFYRRREHTDTQTHTAAAKGCPCVFAFWKPRFPPASKGPWATAPTPACRPGKRLELEGLGSERASHLSLAATVTPASQSASQPVRQPASQSDGLVPTQNFSVFSLCVAMVSLALQRRLAASVLDCGKNRVWLDPSEIAEIATANSRMLHLWLCICCVCVRGRANVCGRVSSSPLRWTISAANRRGHRRRARPLFPAKRTMRELFGQLRLQRVCVCLCVRSC